MANETVTRNDLAEAVYERVGLSRNECADLVEMTIDQVCEALVKRQDVKISGFGTLMVKDKTQRIGRNPKTGEEVPILPRSVLTFRPSQMLRDAVDAGNKK